MKILKRILVLGILGSIIQFITYFVLLYVGLTLGQFIWNPNGLELSEALIFSLEIYLSLILFGILILTTNILIAVLHQNKWSKYLLIFPIIIYTVAWSEDLNAWPLRTGIFIVAGIIALILNPFIHKTLLNMTTTLKPVPKTHL